MDAAKGYRLHGDIEARLLAANIQPNHTVVVHCQTHHRSGLAYLVARLLGYQKLKAYDGSWAEWGNRDDTPIATGMPERAK